MPGTGKAKIKPDTLEAEQEVRHEVESREADRRDAEVVQQQVLNQGLDTGTHSSSHTGVDWSPAFRLRPEATQSFPTTKQVRLRAYELYVERGREDGHDLDDWLNAEKELKAR